MKPGCFHCVATVLQILLARCYLQDAAKKNSGNRKKGSASSHVRHSFPLVAMSSLLAPKSFESAVARVDVSYRVLTGQEHVVELKGIVLRPGEPFTNDCVEIASSFAPHKDTCGIVTVRVKALKPVELVHFEVKYFADLTDQRMLANGFQSWSQARELTANDRIPSIRSTVAYLTQLNLQG